jgi:hypothetical protein
MKRRIDNYSPLFSFSLSVGVAHGKSSISVLTHNLVDISASTNSLALQYFLAEYSINIGAIFLF